MLLTLALGAGAAEIEVELFLATSCPISNRYVPEIRRLAQRFSAQWTAWFPEPGLTAEQLRKWEQEWKLGVAVQRDPQGARAKRAGATVTPEAAVWSGGELIYRGRIDDRYVGWGKSRRVVGQKDLEEVLAALERGEKPARRETKAIGCVIETRY